MSSRNRFRRLALSLAIILLLSLTCVAEDGTDTADSASGNEASIAGVVEFDDPVDADAVALPEGDADFDALEDLDAQLDISLDGDISELTAPETSEGTEQAETTDATESNGVPKTLTLGVKENYRLNVKKATFKSDKPSVAAVSKEGVVTAKKKGTAKITVKSGKKTLGVCKVTVVAAPKAVSLGMKSVALGVRETLKLTPTITEGAHASFTYTSKDKKIATVNAKGVVTAKKTGSTTITVKTHNGKKATLKVKVRKAPTKVTVAPDTLTLNVGQTAALKATLPKKTASFSLSWTSDNAEVAVVDETGIVTAVGPGTAKITVRTFNNKKASCVVTVMESTMEPRLLSPTDLYRGGIFDNTTFPTYGGDDITLVWTAVKGAVQYDLNIERLGYTGDGSYYDGFTVNPPALNDGTVSVTLETMDS